MEHQGEKKGRWFAKLLAWGEKWGLLLTTLIVVTGVCFLFAHRKSGLFIDEIYTYGLSNSHYAPFLTDVAGGSLEDRVLTRQDLLDYVTAGNGFDPGSVYYNQTRDVHPPLYYWLFNLASSLTPGQFSKWTGLALDYILYLLAVLLLFLLALLLFEKPALASAAAALYGLSVIGLSTMLMIRMYVLLTMLSVLLAVLMVKFLNGGPLWLCPLIGLTVFLGLMTQYYFVFFAFFLCGMCVLRGLGKREFKRTAAFALCALVGAALLPLAFPACFDHLFADKLVSGGNALENLKNVSAYAERFRTFHKRVAPQIKAIKIVALASLVCLLPCCKRLLAALRGRKLRFTVLLVLLPALAAYGVSVVVSPVQEPRYVYNLMPFLALAACLPLYLLMESLEGLRFTALLRSGAAALVLALALWEARCLPPDYLYPEHRDYNALLKEHAGAPCVYLTDNYFPPVTQDLVFLLNFDEVFLTGDPASPALKNYLAGFAGSGECVVFIDTSVFWSSGFDPAVMLPRLLEETGYTGFEELYSYELSATYRLTGG